MSDTADTLKIMGVVNMTPDSFSDGGDYLDPDHAIQQCLRAVELGADVIDLGAESTRPGATPVTADQEWRRLEPVMRALVQDGFGPRISVDSRHDDTLLRAHALGVRWFNNVSGLAGSKTLQALAEDKDSYYIAMHMHGEPQSMQQHPLKAKEVESAVTEAFANYSGVLLDAGFARSRIFMDPGIGFGKTTAANLRLLQTLPQFAREHQLLVGVSRKTFIGRLTGIEAPKERDAASKMLELGAWWAGARIIRTHDVGHLALIRETLRAEC